MLCRLIVAVYGTYNKGAVLHKEITGSCYGLQMLLIMVTIACV